MNGLSSIIPAALESPRAALSAELLDKLGARVRDCGLAVCVFEADGSLSYSDCGTFELLRSYAIPSASLAARQAAIAALSIALPTNFVELAPGIGAFLTAVIDRRRVVAAIGVIAKTGSLDSDNARAAAAAIGIDARTLAGLDCAAPLHLIGTLAHTAKCLIATAREMLQTAKLAAEVESLSTQLAQTYEELSLIYQLSSGMKVNRGPADFFRQACSDVAAVMQTRGVGVALNCGKLPSELCLYGELTLPPEQLRRLCETLLAGFRVNPAAVLINDLSVYTPLSFVAPSARRLCAVPLQRQDQVLGCLFAFDKLADDFNTVDAKLLTSIANETTIYLENSMLFADVQQLVLGLMHSLTAAVDAKDAYTCGHSERVALLSRMTAEKAGLSAAVCERVYMSGLLHDVGKIGVPEAVLQKAGKLTDEEFDKIKLHPEIGARILRDVKQIEDVIPGVLHHHERYDGRGYPYGLVGEAIPLMGRVICLADCFDAMTSSRTYRKALPLEVAIAELRKNAGTQFDPQLTEAFLSIGDEKLREIAKSSEAIRLTPYDDVRAKVA